MGVCGIGLVLQREMGLERCVAQMVALQSQELSAEIQEPPHEQQLLAINDDTHETVEIAPVAFPPEVHPRFAHTEHALLSGLTLLKLKQVPHGGQQFPNVLLLCYNQR